MADEALLEAPAEATIDSTGVDLGDTSTDTSSSADGGTADVIDNSDSPQKGETGHLRGAELYKAVKEKLKTGGLTPQEQRSLRNAIHIAAKADEATGGNLDAFTAERSTWNKLADDPESGQTPEQIVESTIAERTFWRDFDAKFEKGDPSTILEMAEANPESFQTLVPIAMDHFAKVNPEGFSAYVAKSAKGYLDSQQIPLQFAILQTFLPSMPDFPGKDRVISALESIYGAVQNLDAMAAKPITAKKSENTPQAGGIDQREQRLQDREMSAARSEWNQGAAPTGIQMRDSEMNRIATAQKVTLDESDKAKIRAAVTEEYNARCAANTKYGEAMRDYLKSGNKRAYQERAVSEYKKLLPGITARHTQAAIDEKKAAGIVKPKTGQAQPVQKTANTGTGQYQWISGHPKTIGKRVDLSRTTNAMLNRNEAYIIGEKALYKWRAPKPS